MIKCPEWLREKCPCGATCEAGAEFSEDSECRRMMMRLGGNAKPRTRLEQIRCMSLEELAQRLLTLHDGDAGSYCRMKPECVAALEENRPEIITDQHCLECVKEWLMEEI